MLEHFLSRRLLLVLAVFSDETILNTKILNTKSIDCRDWSIVLTTFIITKLKLIKCLNCGQFVWKPCHSLHSNRQQYSATTAAHHLYIPCVIRLHYLFIFEILQHFFYSHMVHRLVYCHEISKGYIITSRS